MLDSLDSVNTDEETEGDTISYTELSKERTTAGVPNPNDDDAAGGVAVAAVIVGVGEIRDRGPDERVRTKLEGNEETFWKLSPKTMASPSSSCEWRAEGNPLNKDADEDEAEDLNLSSRSRLNRLISLSSSPSGSVPARTITLVCIPEAQTIN